jgi:hypothetical protein
MLAHVQTRPSLAQPLRGASLSEDGDTVVLRVSPDWAGFAAEHADEYRDLARKAAGRPLKLRVESRTAADAAGDGVPAAEPQKRKQRLMEEASREPAVQEALDIFGGRVVDVRENDKP